MTAERRYTDYNSYLKSLYGERVQKVIIDAGLTCPNRDGTLAVGGCIYCNSRGSGSGLARQGFSIREQVEMGRKAMIRRYKARKFLAYFQSYTTTYTDVSTLKQMFDQALAPDGMVGLSIGTRPDCVNLEILDLIESYAGRFLVWLEYGLQSVHDKTLAAINRGHDFASFKRAVDITAGRGINVCAHVILGLPGETREMMIETARVLGSMPVQGVKIHLLYVIRGTGLETLYNQGLYRCMDLDGYAETVCEFIEHLPPEIIIQRLTGDPHPDELVAPDWALGKARVFNRIQQRLEERDSWQGKALGAADVSR